MNLDIICKGMIDVINDFENEGVYEVYVKTNTYHTASSNKWKNRIAGIIDIGNYPFKFKMGDYCLIESNDQLLWVDITENINHNRIILL